MTAPRPGWYPDPAGAAELYRWWDGQNWTAATSGSRQAPAPGREPIPGDDLFTPELAGIVTPARPRRRSALRSAVAITVGFALFVSAGLGLGLVVWRDEGSTRPRAGELPPLTAASTPAPRTSASSDVPTGQLDDSTGWARINRASMQLPRMPYKLKADPLWIGDLFDVVFTADAVVHSRYNGRNSWTSTVALAHLNSTTAATTDLDASGLKAMESVAQHFFGGHPATTTAVSTSDRSVDGHPGVLVTAKVRYSIPKLPSSSDDVSVLLVRLDDGSMIAALTSVPDDASPEVRQLARTALESLTIR